MKTSTLVKRNLAYYWRTNLAVALGVATSVAVLAGALLVGDSVRASLRELFLNRLGRADEVISATHFFREQLAGDFEGRDRTASRFEAVCPLIVLDAVVTHEKSGRRGSGVQVYGVDDRFWKFHHREGAAPADREILVSESLSRELGCAAGDSLLVRIEKPSAIPAGSLHGRKDDLGRTIRLTLREALPASRLGEFSIRPVQGDVRAVFVSLSGLQKEIEQPARVNTMLVAYGGREGAGDSLNSVSHQGSSEENLKDAVTLEDLGLRIKRLDEQHCLSLESESAIIGDSTAEAARAVAASLGGETASIFTYLANSIRSGGREVPYSLVTAIDLASYQRLKQSDSAPAPAPPPILLNDWAARDLGAKAGDTVELEYYVWQEEGRLLTRTAQFRLDGVAPVDAADRSLAPDYPGITETESLSDRDPPFPIDLKRVRPRDEDYWHKYRATPKAFITLDEGQRLWQSRYGKLTSVRFYPRGASLTESVNPYEQSLVRAIDPLAAGFAIHPARLEGVEASRGATDFGEYFTYFSFFIVVSALLLTGLFFKLGIEQRLREIGTLRAIGFSAARIRTLFLVEGVLLAAIGGVLGAVGALAYGGLMMMGLRTWWVGAVGTTLLSLHVTAASLLLGLAGAALAAFCCIVWTLRALAPASPRSLLAGLIERKEKGEKVKRGKGERNRPALFSLSLFAFSPFRLFPFPLFPFPFFLLGLLLLAAAWLKLVGQTPAFFGAGALLLVALLCYEYVWLRQTTRRLIAGSGLWPVSRMGLRNATHRPGRSILCIALIASATFIIVAVDAFRRDDRAASLDKKSGSGGFPLLAQSLLPLHHDPNSAEGREALTLTSQKDFDPESVTFSRFRVRAGDDASCLNLYQPRQPRILAATGDFVRSGRFAFQDSLARTEEEKANPWLLLESDLDDGAVPVIADANSLTYVLHRELGDEIVLNREGASPVRMRLVAALADSIFQGELLMAEKNFLRLFPDEGGYSFFLLDVAPEAAPQVAAVLEEQLSDFGFDAMPTGERLASFHRVENTYLSTFQALGGLGLVLGTLGLATVLLRNVLERRRELALLSAIGYNRRHFALMIVAENALLVCCGIATGATSALLAIAPALFARGGHLPALSLGVLLLAVVVTGLGASVVATLAALRSPLLPALRSE